MKRITCIILSLALVFLASGTSSAISIDNSSDVQSDQKLTLKESKRICTATIDDDFVPDEIIVKFNNSKSKELYSFTVNDFQNVSATSVENLTKYTSEILQNQKTQHNITRQKQTAGEISYIDENEFHQCWLIKLDKKSKENVLACIRELEKRDDVISVSPNYYYTQDDISREDISDNTGTISTFDEKDAVPDDYSQTTQWAIKKIGLPSAWNYTTGRSSIKVGILDTGINGNHPDLAGNLQPSDSELHKNFVNSSSPLYDPDGHGTLVAGIIGAKGNNGEGITGVCWDISLISLRIAYYDSTEDDYVSNTSKTCTAIDYAKANNISILNYSYSGTNDNNDFETALNGYNGLFVCSAGNKGTDIGTTNNHRYPACYNTPNMICVANTTEDDVLNEIKGEASCYSSTYVHLAAPGTAIYSTYGDDYDTFTGTSLSTPYVTGVAALLKSKYDDMQTRTIKYYIVNRGVDIIPELEGKVATSGRLNAYKALNSVTTYTVTYNAGGGGGSSMANTKVIYNNYTPLRKNTYTRSGYTFVGWHAKRDSDDKWYYTNGQSSHWYLEGQQPPGYSKYLYTDEKVVFNTTSVNYDIVTMTAQWSPNYTITFKGNSPTSGTMSPINRVYGVEYNLPANTFSKTNFYFQHWYAKDSNGKMYYSGSGGAGWYTPGLQPDGYTRVDFSDKMKITASTLTGITPNMTITMNAYWKPMTGILGDANVDDVVSVKDASYIEKYISGLVSMSDHQKRISDVDFSGTITVKDVTLVQKFVAGNIDEFGA